MSKIILLLALISSIACSLPSTRLHFIRCGGSDATLIESNGLFAMIDSSNPYIGDIEEVEKVKIDPSRGEKDQGTSDKDSSIYGVIAYLNHLNVKHLEFVLGTHAHSDHMGGIPALAAKFVDAKTTYYYKNYRTTQEDIIHIDWANPKYYQAAFNSMRMKGANLVDITDKDVNFDFGELKIRFVHTELDPYDAARWENHHSVGTLIAFGDKKMFLAADIEARDDKGLVDAVGKVDFLKLAHHGVSESSYDFLKAARPANTVIFNSHLTEYARKIAIYLRKIIGGSVYVTGNVAKPTQDVKNAAIRVNLLSTGSSYEIEMDNTGEQPSAEGKDGWSQWYDYWVYIKSNSLAVGWNELDWSMGKNWFYFSEEGIMQVKWQFLKWSQGESWFYFDEANGYMKTGFQFLEKEGKKNWFYFDLKDGYMYTGWHDLEKEEKCTFYFESDGAMLYDVCKEIDGKEYCFKEDGCLVK